MLDDVDNVPRACRAKFIYIRDEYQRLTVDDMITDEEWLNFDEKTYEYRNSKEGSTHIMGQFNKIRAQFEGIVRMVRENQDLIIDGVRRSERWNGMNRYINAKEKTWRLCHMKYTKWTDGVQYNWDDELTEER